MNTVDAENIALRLIDTLLNNVPGKQHNNWKFAWNNRKTAFGVCNHTRKTIYLSRYLTATEQREAIEQTILHEIAHAIAGSAAGHGPAFKAACSRIGCRADGFSRKATAEVDDSKVKWVMVLGTEIRRRYYRRPAQQTFRSVSAYYVKGQKAATQGKMKLMPYSEYVTMMNNNRNLRAA